MEAGLPQNHHSTNSSSLAPPQFLNRRLPKGEVLFKVDRLKKTPPQRLKRRNATGALQRQMQAHLTMIPF